MAQSATRSGRFVESTVAGETVRAFLPSPLPPDPPLELTSEDQDLMERANRALGRLDGVAALLPDPELFIYMYVRKEAVLSSQIEGTQSSLSDLLLFETGEAPGAPLEDVGEVSRYVDALNHGLARLRDGFPLSLRLIREMHEKLLGRGRGSEKSPGEFRRSQNWIGGTRPGNASYVPPSPADLPDCLGSFEKFLHDIPVRTPLLVKAALGHAQFESIHPFLDGNGRIGRLLITFLLCAESALSEPILYLSLFFRRHRETYYEKLQRVRTHGEWEEWLRFFLEGVLVTSREAVETARRILSLFREDEERIKELGRAAGSALRVHTALQRRPLLWIAKAAEMTRLTEPTVGSSLQRLESMGIVGEVTGKQRYRIYAYTSYLALLEEGTSPQLPE